PLAQRGVFDLRGLSRDAPPKEADPDPTRAEATCDGWRQHHDARAEGPHGPEGRRDRGYDACALPHDRGQVLLRSSLSEEEILPPRAGSLRTPPRLDRGTRSEREDHRERVQREESQDPLRPLLGHVGGPTVPSLQRLLLPRH